MQAIAQTARETMEAKMNLSQVDLDILARSDSSHIWVLAVDFGLVLMLEPPTATKALRKFLINPHQRCGYSDSPFARKHTFLYCRV